MPRTLTGAVISGDSITATWIEDGTPGSGAGPWGAAVTDAASDLQSAVDAEFGEPAAVVQVYTAASDPDGTPNADPGDIVDAWDGANGNPDMRFGLSAAVPNAIATARDAFKAALAAAI